MAIEKGSTVRLKDIESPIMIVWEIDPDNLGSWICHWFNESQPMEKSYPGAMLIEVTPPHMDYGFA